MKYFFSSPSSSSLPVMRELGVNNYLFSFMVGGKTWYKVVQPTETVLMDSGAFSVWNSGKTIDIVQYKNFLKTLPDHFLKVSLDVIPKTGSTPKEIEHCCEQGIENYKFLCDGVKNVMPVYHYGEHERFLKTYMEYTDYIGISPANDTSEKCKRQFFSQVFSILGSKIRTHAFGYSSFSGLVLYPFTSVDSITYNRWQKPRGKRGCMFREDDYTIKNIRINSTSLNYFLYERIRVFLEYEKFITELWEGRGISWSTT